MRTIKYFCIMTAVWVILHLFTPLDGVPRAVSIGYSQDPSAGISTGRTRSGEIEFIEGRQAAKEGTISRHFTPFVPIVASYREGDHSWTFFAKVLGLRDVSIYGRPGTIAQIEFLRNGEPIKAWAVIQIDNYYFSDGQEAIAVGQEIMLEVSGEHVSSQGVNWEACPNSEEYCQYAGFIEGGFPVSEDYNGLTMSPSNMLIYSGYGSNDWINGMLAWMIKTVPAKADQDCIHCPSGMQLDYFP